MPVVPAELNGARHFPFHGMFAPTSSDGVGVGRTGQVGAIGGIEGLKIRTRLSGQRHATRKERVLAKLVPIAHRADRAAITG